MFLMSCIIILIFKNSCMQCKLLYLLFWAFRMMQLLKVSRYFFVTLLKFVFQDPFYLCTIYENGWFYSATKHFCCIIPKFFSQRVLIFCMPHLHFNTILNEVIKQFHIKGLFCFIVTSFKSNLWNSDFVLL